MKTKQFLFLMGVLLLLLGVVACDKPEKENEVPKELIGSWKLKGLGETANNTLRELEPRECEPCYVLTLKNDGVFYGLSTSNTMSGKFSVDKKKLTIVFSNLFVTKVAEVGDGNLYLSYFGKTRSYFISEEGLKLFYEDNRYLLYKKIEL